MSVIPISQDLFQQYKHFYECLINGCLVENGVAQMNVNIIPNHLKEDAKRSIAYYHNQCHSDSESDIQRLLLPQSELSSDSDSESVISPISRLSIPSDSDSESDSETDDETHGYGGNKRPPHPIDVPFHAKFYVMKATHMVDGKMEIDYPQFRILVGDYVYTNFRPIWPDGKSHVGMPWSEIVLDEHYSPPGSNTPSSRPFRYKASSDELFFKESEAGEWQQHPMGSHYDQLAYYLSDYENTFSVEG
jgi:hypothetical protein